MEANYKLFVTKPGTCRELLTDLEFFRACGLAEKREVIGIRIECDSTSFVKFTKCAEKRFRSWKRRDVVRAYLTREMVEADTVEAMYIFNLFPQLMPVRWPEMTYYILI